MNLLYPCCIIVFHIAYFHWQVKSFSPVMVKANSLWGRVLRLSWFPSWRLKAKPVLQLCLPPGSGRLCSDIRWDISRGTKSWQFPKANGDPDSQALDTGDPSIRCFRSTTEQGSELCSLQFTLTGKCIPKDIQLVCHTICIEAESHKSVFIPLRVAHMGPHRGSLHSICEHPLGKQQLQEAQAGFWV